MGECVHAGIVDEDIEPAPFVENAIDGGVDFRFLCHVQPQTAGAGRPRGRRLGARGIDIGMGHATAVGRQAVGDGLANAAGRPRDQADFACQIGAHG